MLALASMMPLQAAMPSPGVRAGLFDRGGSAIASGILLVVASLLVLALLILGYGEPMT
ncbi:MAG: hypothetical protein MJD61_05115 [Proteobacteria bacterium]|nr:hypothetical protein [Pseudomonadota bacterium]